MPACLKQGPLKTKIQQCLPNFRSYPLCRQKCLPFFSLSRWNTWGFPGCWSGFNSSQMVENTVFGRKWMIENKSLLVLNNCSFFRGLNLTVPQVIGCSSRMLPCCAVLCSALWDGVGWDMMRWVGVDFLIQGLWMLFVLQFPQMTAVFYCLLLWGVNLWCPATCPEVSCHTAYQSCHLFCHVSVHWWDTARKLVQ